MVGFFSEKGDMGVVDLNIKGNNVKERERAWKEYMSSWFSLVIALLFFEKVK